MSVNEEWVIHTDGGARGNPGPAAFAFTIERPGQPALEENGYLGETTNNVAEYTALVRALTRATDLGGKCLVINSDSELLVQQMKGAYKVKHPNLQPLYRQAVELCKQFDKVTFRHLRREYNSRADQLCNDALDEAASGVRVTPPRPRTAPPAVPDETATPRARALACLSRHAAAWAKGDASAPAPETVLDELCAILGKS